MWTQVWDHTIETVPTVSSYPLLLLYQGYSAIYITLTVMLSLFISHFGPFGSYKMILVKQFTRPGVFTSVCLAKGPLWVLQQPARRSYVPAHLTRASVFEVKLLLVLSKTNSFHKPRVNTW